MKNYIKPLSIFILPLFSMVSTQVVAHDEEGNVYTMSTVSAALASAAKAMPQYNSDDEYERHQQVSDRFFRRVSKKPIVRGILSTFKTELVGNHAFTPINLDGLSSRSRILLFRELTALVKGEEKSIPFIFHEKKFSLNLNPTLRQPGDGIITTIGKIKEIRHILNSYKNEYQRKYAKKLINARKTTNPYHPDIDDPILKEKGKSFNLGILNVLLDFEVARRLQGAVDEENATYFAKEVEELGEQYDWIGNMGRKGEDPGVSAKAIADAESILKDFDEFIKNIEESYTRNLARATAEGADSGKRQFMRNDKKSYDSVPVASAIVGALKISTKDHSILPLEKFFHAERKFKTRNGVVFRCGDYNAFQGAASPNHREMATKKIIKELRGGAAAKNSTHEQIHQEYLEVFGGDSESEGESYD